jgi:heme/copper-type cytochrome/quinol oxidase subunit 2
MRTRLAVVVLLLVIGVGLRADETVDSNQPTDTAGTVTTSTTTTTVAGTPRATPGWIHMVRLAALAGPIAFLLLAWLIGAIVHYRLVRREHEQFPVMRGSRTPQTVPMIISAALFFVPFVLFVFFELRSRREIRLGIGGVVDEWLPVTRNAWLTLLICLVLALIPWLFARRADTVS